MPGILPMKVIKVGTSAQSRIAQACDRCRSKKIRCDGIRPCCSQCANVGFECKTSDKLSRRAFPRGYTESLEERVRVLEGEVRELKDLLDEKDEKIDMLSRMHNNRRTSHSSLISTPALSMSSPGESPAPKEDTFRLLTSPSAECEALGPSTGRAFLDAFQRKLAETGRSCSSFVPSTFLPVYESSVSRQPTSYTSSIPPRLFSDRCINIFWQEHAPLFPVLHKPTFLRLYEEYVADPDSMVDNQKLAMLHLVFCIAGFSSDLPDKDEIAMCENQWRRSLSMILLDSTLSTLQCLVLACLYCSQTGDYQALQTYKAIAVGLAQRLGLHHSQKRFSYGALTTETRKKVFWTLYTVDAFTASSMGLPMLLRDSDIEAEYPVAIDDEYVEEKGLLPTLPGEPSKLSNALALFAATRILSKVLQKLYPASSTQELSLQDMATFESELEQWQSKLPQHLKLTFVADKPSTDVTGNRSALLSLAYYHIRSLLHRPAVGSTLGDKASPSVIALADSAKHIVQIVQLLEERSMSFSFCINKNTTLILCGLTLLYQSLDLKKNGMLLRDHQRLVCTIAAYLSKHSATSTASDFKKLIASVAPPASPSSTYISTNPNTKNSTPSPRQPMSGTQSRYAQPSAVTADGFDSELITQQERMRRATLHTMPPVVGMAQAAQNRASLKQRQGSNVSLPAEYRTSQFLTTGSTGKASASSSDSGASSLDYVILETPSPVPQQNQQQYKTQQASVGTSEWETLLSGLDSGSCNIFDGIYGGTSHGNSGLALPLPDPIYIPASSSLARPPIKVDECSNPGSSYEDWDQVTEDSVSAAGQQWDMNVAALGLDFETGFGLVDEALSSDGEGTASGNAGDIFNIAEYKEMMRNGMGDGAFWEAEPGYRVC